MYYVYVKDGNITGGKKTLPKSWNNISNFDRLDNATLILHGWYPHRLVESPKSENEVFLDSVFRIEGNEVVEYKNVRPKTEQEIQDELNSLWLIVRSNRNIMLSECDWTQLPDSPLTEEKKAEWITYRQSLRDITLQQDPFNIIWPTKPE